MQNERAKEIEIQNKCNERYKSLIKLIANELFQSNAVIKFTGDGVFLTFFLSDEKLDEAIDVFCTILEKEELIFERIEPSKIRFNV